MIEKLDRFVGDIGAVHSKLILLVGSSRIGKTALLGAFGRRRNVVPLNVGLELASLLSVVPQKQRHLQANTILRELADAHAKDDLLLVDNIELLFDQSLKLDPLDLLKRHAHARRVVGVWPGELREGRLTYADMGHPEHQSYAVEGLVTFEIWKQ